MAFNVIFLVKDRGLRFFHLCSDLLLDLIGLTFVWFLSSKVLLSVRIYVNIMILGNCAAFLRTQSGLLTHDLFSAVLCRGLISWTFV